MNSKKKKRERRIFRRRRRPVLQPGGAQSLHRLKHEKGSYCCILTMPHGSVAAVTWAESFDYIVDNRKTGSQSDGTESGTEHYQLLQTP